MMETDQAAPCIRAHIEASKPATGIDRVCSHAHCHALSSSLPMLLPRCWFKTYRRSDESRNDIRSPAYADRLSAYASTMPFWRFFTASQMRQKYNMPMMASKLEPTIQQVGRMPGLPTCAVVIA